MADIGGSKVLLFSGQSAINDTWVYDAGLNSWTNQSPANPKPSARSSHAMAYLGNEAIVLFGGGSGDTWVTNGMGPTVVTLASFTAASDALLPVAWGMGTIIGVAVISAALARRRR